MVAQIMSILLVWNAMVCQRKSKISKISNFEIALLFVIEIATFNSHTMAGKQQIFIRIAFKYYTNWVFYKNFIVVVVQWPIHHAHCAISWFRYPLRQCSLTQYNQTKNTNHFMWLNSIRIVLQTSLYYGQHMTIDDPYLRSLFSSPSVGILFIVYLRGFHWSVQCTALPFIVDLVNNCIYFRLVH